MKILLDHNIPHALRPLFPDEHEVYTTHYLGWSEYEDEQFLTAAVDESFSVIVTLDRGLPHQQQVAAYDVGLIVLAVHPATPDHLEAHMDRVIESLPVAASKQQVVVLE
jgi:predicted nuclease of predicted toxin-antitoxin system